jgi:hypothetical protein
VAPKQPDGTDCTVASQCCSDKCNQEHHCDGACRSAASTCNPVDPAPCCVGFYCTGLCVPCHAKGEAPDELFGVKNAKSCCSGEIDDGKCE